MLCNSLCQRSQKYYEGQARYKTTQQKLKIQKAEKADQLRENTCRLLTRQNVHLTPNVGEEKGENMQNPKRNRNLNYNRTHDNRRNITRNNTVGDIKDENVHLILTVGNEKG